MIDLKNQYSDFYKFYGRRVSKKLSSKTLKIIENYFSSYSFDHEVIESFNNKKYLYFDSKYKKICLEIGFGNGDFLLSNASNSNDTLFIGSEVYLNGFSKILKYINTNDIKNIKICNTNFIFLIKVLIHSSIDLVYFINPDPWPKLRHHKRRLLSIDNLNMIKEKLKKDGKIIITTDSEDYYNFVFGLSRDKKLKFHNSDFGILHEDNNLYGISDYQRKAIVKKNKIYYMKFFND